MARQVSVFGAARHPAQVTASLTIHLYPQQLPARQASCNCRCYTPSSHCLHTKAKTRRPPVNCAAWGRKRSRPSNPSEDNKPQSGTDAAPLARGNGASKQSAAEDIQSAATSQIEDIGDLADRNDSSQTKPGRTRHSRGASWEDWEDWDPDWEVQPGDPGPQDQFRKSNPRRGMGSKTPRDEYLRPMIDTLGIQYRLGFKQMEAEERVQTEFETNQWESREAVKFAGMIILLQDLDSMLHARAEQREDAAMA